ncbi:MAG: tetratricopeptide repeat protein [Acidobacteriota bacterium]
MRWVTALLMGQALAFAQPDALAVKSQRGKQLMAEGRFAEAIPVYEELVRAVPGNPGLLLNLGLAEQMAGRPREAIPHFAAAVKLDPRMFPAWLSMGACYMDLGEPARAVAPLEKAAALDRANPGPRYVLGDALTALRRPGEAARNFRELARLQPEDPKVWYKLGRAYEALSQRAFEQLDKSAQGSAWWLALVAGTRASEGRNRAAFALYREALAKMPALRGAHAAIADIYRKTNHPDWAAVEDKREQALAPPDCAAAKLECAFRGGRFLEAARGTQPASAESLHWQTRAYNALAAQAFARLSQLAPSAELYSLKAQIENGRNRPREAAEAYREALKLAPGDADLELGLAAALGKARDYKSAAQIVERLIKRAPDSPLLNFLYGDSLLMQSQPEPAVPYLERAVRLEPENLQARASLGLALARAGKPESAIPHLEKALAADSDGSLHYQLAAAYRASGRGELARQALEKYQSLQKGADSVDSGDSAITPP